MPPASTAETTANRLGLAGRLGVGAVFALAYLGWWLLFRHWLIQGDDFMSASIGGARGGRFTFGAWLADSWRDYRQATGRQAGSLFRIFLRGGPELIKWVMPVQQVVLALALWVWASQRRRPAAVSMAMTALAASALPLMAWRVPGLMGEAVVWAQASFDYIVGPALCLLFIGRLATSGDRPLNGRSLWLLAPIAFVGPLLHEAGSLATLFALVALGLTGLLRPVPNQILAGVAALASFIQVTAPGMWLRLDQVEAGQQGDTGASLHLARGANSLWALGTNFGSVIWLVCGVIFLAGATSTGWRARVAATVHAVLLVVTAVIVWPRWDRHFYANAITADQRSLAIWLIGLSVACGIAALWCLWDLRSSVSAAPVVAILGLAGALAPPFAAGMVGARAYFPAALWAAAATIALLNALLTGPGWPKQLSGALLVALLGLSVWATPQWWLSTHRGMLANAKAFNAVTTQIDQVRAGQKDEVVFPAKFPRPDLLYPSAFLLSRYDQAIILYYDLPDGTKLVQARR